MWGDTLPKNRFLRFWVLLAHRYLKHNVATQSAALAFYLLFMIFPFLIFISALLGLLNLNVAGIVSVLADFLPEVVLELTELYLTYVRENPSPQLMVFGLVFSVYFPMRATNSLMGAVRTAYHLGPPRGAVSQWLRVLLYTVTLIAAIALTLTLMTFGERALWYAVNHFHLPEWMAALWVHLRFPGGGSRELFRTAAVVRVGAGYAPAHAEHLAGDALFPCGMDGCKRSLFLLRQSFFTLLSFIWLHRRYHCGANLAEPHRRDADFRGGGQRRAHQYA